MQVVSEGEIICKRACNKLLGQLLDDHSRQATYERVEEDVEPSSSIDEWRVNDSFQLESSNFQAGVLSRLSIGVRRGLELQFMFLLEDLQPICNLNGRLR